jgi:hypothetical protein
MADYIIANKEDIIKCLRSRQNGINIVEANIYTSKIEVNNIL